MSAAVIRLKVEDLAVYVPAHTVRCVIETEAETRIVNAEDPHGFLHTVVPAFVSAREGGLKAVLLERVAPRSNRWEQLHVSDAGLPSRSF